MSVSGTILTEIYTPNMWLIVTNWDECFEKKCVFIFLRKYLCYTFSIETKNQIQFNSSNNSKQCTDRKKWNRLILYSELNTLNCPGRHESKPNTHVSTCTYIDMWIFVFSSGCSCSISIRRQNINISKKHINEGKRKKNIKC